MGESQPKSWIQTERSEVCTHDQGQDSPIQIDLARLIRCLLYGTEETLNFFNVTGLLTFCLRMEMSLTFVIRFFGTSINDWENIKENGGHFPILVCYFFNAKWHRSRFQSRWENLDHGQYWSIFLSSINVLWCAIKFVNLLVPSPCETEPYNKL